MYKSATNVQELSDPILSVPNTTGVPNVNTASNVPKMTNNDPSVPKPISVPTGVVYQRCTKRRVHQNATNEQELTRNDHYSVLNTDPILSVPKCNWCTKRNDRTNSIQND